MSASDSSEVKAISCRLNMVDRQLKARGITDGAVLAAMRTVPRHLFVPGQSIEQAYGDYPLPIGHEQTISQPYIVGSMTQEMAVDGNSRVLEIGTGCGYQTAVLAEIVQHVYSIEYIPDLFEETRDRLHRLGYNNITTMAGDGSLGWPRYAPFASIIVTAAAPAVPPALSDQLAEGGRLLIPLQVSGFSQELYVIEKTPQGIKSRSLYAVRFVPMRGAIED